MVREHMVRIFVVDNGGQWTHREWRVLRELGAETEIIPNTTPLEDLDVDGLVLSGGTPRVGLSQTLGRIDDYLKALEFPILGICAGHQYIARFFGGSAAPSGIPEYGKIEIEILAHGRILAGLPDRFVAWESHNDEVKSLPPGFMNLARSENCDIQAIEHRRLPVFGLQFHPEVTHTEFGREIFRNFMNICEEWL